MNGIFISYRRQDSQGFAGRLTDDLSELFGEERVFRDVDIIPGSDFSQAIHQAIEGCEALLVVIGKRWLEARDAAGQQRIFNADDWVRLEIEAGLAGDKIILPILVGGAEMPRESDLPPSIAEISRRQAFVVSDRRWKTELQELHNFLLQHVPSLREPLATTASGHGRGNRADESWQEATRETFRSLGERIAEELAQRRKSSSTRQAHPPWLLRIVFNLLKKVIGFGVVLLIAYFIIKNYGDASARGVLNDLEIFVSGLVKKFLSYFS